MKDYMEQHAKDMIRGNLKHEIYKADMARTACDLLSTGYAGHAMDDYEWQASQLIPCLERAIKFAKELNNTTTGGSQ